jgi:hypothetical protein
MFEELERDYSYLSWILQSLLAFFGPIILLMILASLLEPYGDTPTSLVLEYLFIAFAGFALALALAAIARSSPSEGRFVSVVPVSLVLLICVRQAASFGIRSLIPFFYVAGPGSAEEGWVLMLLTFPTWGCCWYSAAMWWRRRRA